MEKQESRFLTSYWLNQKKTGDTAYLFPWVIGGFPRVIFSCLNKKKEVSALPSLS